MSQEGLKVGTPEAGGASRLGAQGDGGPAFPCDLDQFHRGFQGASLRDIFAAKALVGLLGRPAVSWSELGKQAFEIADTMLAARGAA
jgi:hypothetical protein